MIAGVLVILSSLIGHLRRIGPAGPICLAALFVQFAQFGLSELSEFGIFVVFPMDVQPCRSPTAPAQHAGLYVHTPNSSQACSTKYGSPVPLCYIQIEMVPRGFQ